jgi:hypothetical protein
MHPTTHGVNIKQIINQTILMIYITRYKKRSNRDFGGKEVSHSQDVSEIGMN